VDFRVAEQLNQLAERLERAVPARSKGNRAKAHK
jgi:hypothetical protein